MFVRVKESDKHFVESVVFFIIAKYIDPGQLNMVFHFSTSMYMMVILKQVREKIPLSVRKYTQHTPLTYHCDHSDYRIRPYKTQKITFFYRIFKKKVKQENEMDGKEHQYNFKNDFNKHFCQEI